MLNVTLPALSFMLFLMVQMTIAQEAIQDTLKSVRTIGVFDGKKVTVGNFETETVFKINDYCISPADISQSLVDSLTGKKIIVNGKLKILTGKTFPAKTSTDGTIYEPYKEPDKMFIIQPTFTIMK
jgi:hypothetical protein